MRKKILAVFFVLFMYSAVSYGANYELLSSTPVSAGLTRNEYRVTGDGTHYANVLVCDLNNPYLKIDLIAGQGEYGRKATVSKMAENSNASAVTNGDFFNMRLEGAPNGASVKEGRIVSSPCVIQDVYSLGIDDSNTAQISQIGFWGELQTPSGKIYPIDGLNKTYYWYEPDLQYSHENKLQLYNDFWGANTRGDSKNSEVLINADGIVEQISEGQSFNFEVPDGKYILQADGTAMDFIRENVRIGEKVNLVYGLTPNVNWKFLIGGHALLVDNGQTVPYYKEVSSLDGNRARTAVGISADGKTVYIASVEGKTSRSNGMRLYQLSNFMQAIGCNRALNLDGGGSTAMVVNENGYRRRVINPEKNGAERRVVSGIGVFSTAVPGKAVGFNVSGPDRMVVGETQYFGLGNGWDGNGNPASAEGYGYSLYVNEGDGVINGNYFTAERPGTIMVTISRTDGLMSYKNVVVEDASAVQDIALDTSARRVAPGDSISYSLKGRLSDGRIIDLDTKSAQFQLYDLDGYVDTGNQMLSIFDLYRNRSGQLGVSFGDKGTSAALYDKNTNIVEMHVGKREYKVNDEARSMDTEVFTSGGRTVVPVRFIVEALGGDVSWHEGTGTILISCKDKEIEIPLNSNTIDVNGEKVSIDSPAVLRGDRSFVPIRFIAESLGMKIGYRPLDERVTIVDENPQSFEGKVVRMNVGRRDYKINNELRYMDTEVFTKNGRTMVPVRFLVEGLGGNIEWRESDMTVIMEYEGNRIEIPIDSKKIKVNGEEKKMDSPAVLKGERSFVPIRFIAEALGMNVKYRPLDERVTISK